MTLAEFCHEDSYKDATPKFRLKGGSIVWEAVGYPRNGSGNWLKVAKYEEISNQLFIKESFRRAESEVVILE